MKIPLNFTLVFSKETGYAWKKYGSVFFPQNVKNVILAVTYRCHDKNPYDGYDNGYEGYALSLSLSLSGEVHFLS